MAARLAFTSIIRNAFLLSELLHSTVPGRQPCRQLVGKIQYSTAIPSHRIPRLPDSATRGCRRTLD